MTIADSDKAEFSSFFFLIGFRELQNFVIMLWRMIEHLSFNDLMGIL